MKDDSSWLEASDQLRDKWVDMGEQLRRGRCHGWFPALSSLEGSSEKNLFESVCSVRRHCFFLTFPSASIPG